MWWVIFHLAAPHQNFDSGQILNLTENKINKINLGLLVHCKHFNIHHSKSPPFAANHFLKVQDSESHQNNGLKTKQSSPKCLTAKWKENPFICCTLTGFHGICRAGRCTPPACGWGSCVIHFAPPGTAFVWLTPSWSAIIWSRWCAFAPDCKERKCVSKNNLLNEMLHYPVE